LNASKTAFAQFINGISQNLGGKGSNTIGVVHALVFYALSALEAPLTPIDNTGSPYNGISIRSVLNIYVVFSRHFISLNIPDPKFTC